jgi:hypothetical protein
MSYSSGDGALMLRRSGIIEQRAFGHREVFFYVTWIVHFGPVLPYQVQLLQLRLGRLFPRRLSALRRPRVFGHRMLRRNR